jgi:hypothetical protein
MTQINSLFTQLQHLFFMLILLVVVLVLLGTLFYLFLVWYKWRDREKKSLETVLLLVAVPQDNEVKIDAMEQIISSLYSLYSGAKFKFFNRFKAQASLSFDLVADHDSIKFYVSCPRSKVELIERQIHGVYSGAEIQPVDEYNIFTEKGKVEYAWLELKKSSFYPLKTYRELSTDPLSALTSTMAKLQEGEAAAIQLVISPVDGAWSSEGKAFISSTKKSESDPEKASFKVDARTLEGIEHKCNQPGFETSIRLVVCAPQKEIAKAHLDNIKSAFSQFNSSNNQLKGKKIRLPYSFMIDFIYRYPPVFWWKTKTILSPDEIASVFHFPNKTIETPNINWVLAKQAAAPPNTPEVGIYIGDNLYRGTKKEIRISQSDRQRHFYIVGQTGVGKSWLLADMALQDIKAGRGVCFIDPHDTFESILERIPPERAEDVIYFDPSQVDRPMGLNIMQAKTEDQKHFIASSIINLMYKLYDPYKTGIVGPRFEHSIRNAMLTVMVEPGATFIEVVRCLTDPKYVQELLPKVQDPIIRRFWTDQIAQTSDFHKSETLDYIVSKFGRFITNTMMRNIIGQSESAFDFRKVMDEGKILIINLAKGTIGEENSGFLGLILIPQILMAAMSRQDVPEEERRDFYLYVDEFQNFATQDFAVIMSEARKYRLNLTVGNQFISQMEDEVKNAVFGNVGTICTFRVGINDANYLIRQYQPTFSEKDLLNIEVGNAYMKTMVNGKPVDPFSVKVAAKERLLPANRKLSEMIKRLSSLKYGRPRAVVESEINKRARL